MKVIIGSEKSLTYSCTVYVWRSQAQQSGMHVLGNLGCKNIIQFG
jgi:hypothetical protein